MTDEKTLEIRVNNARALAVQSYVDGDDPSIVAKFVDTYKTCSTIYNQTKFGNYTPIDPAPIGFGQVPKSKPTGAKGWGSQ